MPQEMSSDRKNHIAVGVAAAIATLNRAASAHRRNLRFSVFNWEKTLNCRDHFKNVAYGFDFVLYALLLPPLTTRVGRNSSISVTFMVPAWLEPSQWDASRDLGDILQSGVRNGS